MDAKTLRREFSKLFPPEEVGSLKDGTPAILISPPLPPGKHQGLGFFINPIPNSIRTTRKSRYQISELVFFEVTARQKDKSTEGVLALAEARNRVKAHYPRSNVIPAIDQPSRSKQSEDRDLIVLFQLQFDLVINRCI